MGQDSTTSIHTFFVHSADPFGRLRNPTNWSFTNVLPTFLFERGYTGHEHLYKFGLINMNGRVYDPALGRFLSPDPFITNPANSQNYNRYSYCLNNPLKYTDPSRYHQKPLDWDMENPILGSGGGYMGSIANGTFRPYGQWSMPASSGSCYDWGLWQYIHDGQLVPFAEVFNNVVKLNSVNFNAAASINNFMKDVVGSGLSLYSVNAFGKTHYVTCEGEIGKTIIDDGGIRFDMPVQYLLDPFGDAKGQGGGNPWQQTAGTIATWGGLTVDAAWQIAKIPTVAYNIAYNTTLLKGVDYLKPASYVASGISFVSDIYLSSTIDPTTGKPYQSWGETRLNTGVSGIALYAGGWAGVVIQLNYQASKAYMETIIAHPDWAPYPVRGFNR